MNCNVDHVQIRYCVGLMYTPTSYLAVYNHKVPDEALLGEWPNSKIVSNAFDALKEKANEIGIKAVSLMGWEIYGYVMRDGTLSRKIFAKG